MASLIHGALWGIAVGEALGLPVCKLSSDERKGTVVADLLAFDPAEQMERGSWSSITSLSMATFDALCRNTLPLEIMECYRQFFKNWEYSTIGLYYHGNPTTQAAVFRSFQLKTLLGCGIPDAVDSGALQRTLPMAFYLNVRFGLSWIKNAESYPLIHEVCELTHPHPLCKMACGIYLAVVNRILSGLEMNIAVDEGVKTALAYYEGSEVFQEYLPRFEHLSSGAFRQVDSLGGFALGDDVADTLTTVLWVLYHTTTFQEAVLAAVNLPGTEITPDVLGALVGGPAGIHFGVETIPEIWRSELVAPERINAVCDQFFLHTIKKRIEKALPLLSFFRRLPHDAFSALDRKGFPERDNKPDELAPMRQFADLFYEYGLVRFNYMDILRAHRIVLWSDEMVDTVSTGSAELTLALLTAYIRIERFRAGTWAEAIGRGVFYRGILHLAELSGCSIPGSVPREAEISEERDITGEADAQTDQDE